MKRSTDHELHLESTALEMLKLIIKYNNHIDASRCPEWMSDALLRLEDRGKVVRRSVTVHYEDNGSVNYIGFFLK